MKNLSKLFMLSIALLLGSCDAPERTIGFVTGENAEMQWHLGTQDAIDIVSTVDGLWATQDYEAMRPYFADSLVFTSYEGKTSNTFDDFVEAMTSGTSVSIISSKLLSPHNSTPIYLRRLVCANFCIWS